MSKNTPGPWTYHPEGDGHSRGYIREHAKHYTGMGVAIGKVVGFREHGPSTTDANGYLMASAPQMRDVLTQILQRMHNVMPTDLLKEVQDALSKSEGRR